MYGGLRPKIQKLTSKSTKRKSNSQFKISFQNPDSEVFYAQDSLDLRGSEHASAMTNKRRAENLK